MSDNTTVNSIHKLREITITQLVSEINHCFTITVLSLRQLHGLPTAIATSEEFFSVIDRHSGHRLSIKLSSDTAKKMTSSTILLTQNHRKLLTQIVLSLLCLIHIQISHYFFTQIHHSRPESDPNQDPYSADPYPNPSPDPNPYPPPSVQHVSHEYGYQPQPPPVQHAFYEHGRQDYSNEYGGPEFGSEYGRPTPPVQHVTHKVGGGDYGSGGYGSGGYESEGYRNEMGSAGGEYGSATNMDRPGPAPAGLPHQRTFRDFSMTDENYSLSIRNGKVVLAPANPADEYQHWIKDKKYNTRVTDAEQQPSFALVNKATGEAINHAMGSTHPVRLVPYNPDYLDESVLWAESKDTGEGFRCIRMVNNKILFDNIDTSILVIPIPDIVATVQSSLHPSSFPTYFISVHFLFDKLDFTLHKSNKISLSIVTFFSLIFQPDNNLHYAISSRIRNLELDILSSTIAFSLLVPTSYNYDNKIIFDNIDTSILIIPTSGTVAAVRSSLHSSLFAINHFLIHFLFDKPNFTPHKSNSIFLFIVTFSSSIAQLDDNPYYAIHYHLQNANADLLYSPHIAFIFTSKTSFDNTSFNFTHNKYKLFFVIGSISDLEDKVVFERAAMIRLHDAATSRPKRTINYME